MLAKRVGYFKAVSDTGRNKDAQLSRGWPGEDGNHHKQAAFNERS
jgi:hypothetical protein